MGEFSVDLNSIYGNANAQKVASNSTDKRAGGEMNMDDFLMLMVAQFQNQSIDSTADTTEMMNQMVQMSVIQAVTNLSTLVTQSTSLSYAASLVGKQVTVGELVGSKMNEILGTVTGTGTLNGQQVVFLDDKETPYLLSDIMAIGRLPEVSSKDNASAAANTQAVNAANAGEAAGQNTDNAQETAGGAANEPRDPHVPDEDGALG